MANSTPHLYQGQGQPLSERGQTVPDADPFDATEKPDHYIASPELVDAVHVALHLGQPLLLTGEPGTGKTRLAKSIAWELGLEYFKFHVKSASIGQDLFYQFDSLLRFQHIQERREGAVQPMEYYFQMNALGRAVLMALPKDHPRRSLLPEKLRQKEPARSVVLLDEIDKAPRDLPNDVLDEIERMRFRMPEAPEWGEIKAETRYRPLVVLTSNSEKSLPDAFLRRCVFFHIESPDKDQLKAIVRKRYPEDGPDEDFLEAAANEFMEIRNIRQLRLKPETAGFLAWLSFLLSFGVTSFQLGGPDERWVKAGWSVLAKSREDLETIENHYSERAERQAEPDAPAG